MSAQKQHLICLKAFCWNYSDHGLLKKKMRAVVPIWLFKTGCFICSHTMYLSSGKIQNHKEFLMSKTKAVRMDYSLFSKENL